MTKAGALFFLTRHAYLRRRKRSVFARGGRGCHNWESNTQHAYVVVTWSLLCLSSSLLLLVVLSSVLKSTMLARTHNFIKIIIIYKQQMFSYCVICVFTGVVVSGYCCSSCYVELTDYIVEFAHLKRDIPLSWKVISWNQMWHEGIKLDIEMCYWKTKWHD